MTTSRRLQAIFYTRRIRCVCDLHRATDVWPCFGTEMQDYGHVFNEGAQGNECLWTVSTVHLATSCFYSTHACLRCAKGGQNSTREARICIFVRRTTGRNDKATRSGASGVGKGRLGSTMGSFPGHLLFVQL